MLTYSAHGLVYVCVAVMGTGAFHRVGMVMDQRCLLMRTMMAMLIWIIICWPVIALRLLVLLACVRVLLGVAIHQVMFEDGLPHFTRCRKFFGCGLR